MRGGFPRRIRGAGGHTAPRASRTETGSRAHLAFVARRRVTPSRVSDARSRVASPRERPPPVLGRQISARLGWSEPRRRRPAPCSTRSTSSRSAVPSGPSGLPRTSTGACASSRSPRRTSRRLFVSVPTPRPDPSPGMPENATRPHPRSTRETRVPFDQPPRNLRARAYPCHVAHVRVARAPVPRASRASRGSRDDDFFFPSRLLATVGRRRAALRSSARRPVPRPSSFPPRSLFFPHPSLLSQSPSSTRMPPWRSVFPASSCSASSASTAAR